jgi:hypothetical protein
MAKQGVLQRHRMNQFSCCMLRSFANPNVGQMLTLLKCLCRP